MKNIAIVTDSTACLPRELVDQYSIEIVPVGFVHEDKLYWDGIDITPTEFYKLLAKAKQLPTTSPASPGIYLEVFKRLAKQVSNILVITVSVKFSTMFDCARAAAELATEKLHNVAIEVLDCRTAAGAQAFVVLGAARAAAAGNSLAQTLEAAKKIMSKVYFVAFLDTLYYLAKGGRVPQIAAFGVSLLKIKPLLEILPLAGQASPLDRVRTRPKAISRLLEVIRERVDKKTMHAMVMHSNTLTEAEGLQERLTSEFNCAEIYITDFTPVMGVHTGPGLLGVAFYTDD